jgi:hypothetical protein
MKVEVPNPDKTPKGRLHTPAPKVFRNRKKYTRKVKHDKALEDCRPVIPTKNIP